MQKYTVTTLKEELVKIIIETPLQEVYWETIGYSERPKPGSLISDLFKLLVGKKSLREQKLYNFIFLELIILAIFDIAVWFEKRNRDYLFNAVFIAILVTEISSIMSQDQLRGSFFKGIREAIEYISLGFNSYKHNDPINAFSKRLENIQSESEASDQKIESIRNGFKNLFQTPTTLSGKSLLLSYPDLDAHFFKYYEKEQFDLSNDSPTENPIGKGFNRDDLKFATEMLFYKKK